MDKKEGDSAEVEAPDNLAADIPSEDGAYAYPHDISTQYPVYPASTEDVRPLTQAAPTPSRTPMIVGLSVLGLVILSLVLTLGGTEGERFLSVGAQFVPLAILAALAYGGVKNSASAMFAYLWLAVLGIGVLLISLGFTLFAFIQDWDLLLEASRNPGQLAPAELAQAFKPGVGPAFLWTFLLLALTALAAVLMLLRPVRAGLSRIMPIDPDNFVHKIALCFLTVVTLGSFIPLIVLSGRPPLLEFLGNQTLEGFDVGVRPQDLLYQFVWTIPATLVAAGWPIARSFQAALKRLGMVRPTLMQVGWGVGLGVGLAVIASFALDPAVRWLWEAFGWPVTNVAVFGDLMKCLETPIGAVLIGVTAGIGEEMAVRGLLQPRIGLLASNLVFTAFHAFQYGPDALLSVFVIGLALGVIRARTNTTTSAIVHGVYDFVLVMALVVM